MDRHERLRPGTGRVDALPRGIAPRVRVRRRRHARRVRASRRSHLASIAGGRERCEHGLVGDSFGQFHAAGLMRWRWPFSSATGSQPPVTDPYRVPQIAGSRARISTPAGGLLYRLGSGTTIGFEPRLIWVDSTRTIRVGDRAGRCRSRTGRRTSRGGDYRVASTVPSVWDFAG